MQYSDRIILVKLDTKPIDTVIIQVYMPTSEEDNDEVEIIYEEPNDLIDCQMRRISYNSREF